MLTTLVLRFRCQDDPILKGLTLGLSIHAVTGLVGANGCRKSTLFMNLSGLLRPQQGAMMWQDKPLDYSKRGPLALCQQVATVFQDPDQQVFYTDIDSDIASNLCNLGVDEAEVTHRVEDALMLVDIQHFHHQPTQCLNHGQKKHVAVAKMLVLQVQYLPLNGPTAGLDPSGRTQMIETTKRIVVQGSRVVISSHGIDLIYEVNDAVYISRQGEVFAHDVPGDVFTQTKLIEQAGLAQPWLMKLHTELGFSLCKTEAGFFSCIRENTLKKAS